MFEVRTLCDGQEDLEGTFDRETDASEFAANLERDLSRSDAEDQEISVEVYEDEELLWSSLVEYAYLSAYIVDPETGMPLESTECFGTSLPEMEAQYFHLAGQADTEHGYFAEFYDASEQRVLLSQQNL